MSGTDKLEQELQELLQALAALPDSRNVAIQRARAPLLARKAEIQAELSGSGAIAQGVGAKAVGENGVLVEGDVKGTIVIGDINLTTTQSKRRPLPANKALRHYLDNLIAVHQHLHLQGIRTNSQPLSVALEKVYVSLSVMEKPIPDLLHSGAESAQTNRVYFAKSRYLTLSEALNHYRRLVITGDPGCGKTTLLSYLALTYARTYRDGLALVEERLKLSNEGDYLPVLLPLRDLGKYIRDNYDDAIKDGPAIFFSYLHEYFAAQHIILPEDFFSEPFESGKAVILLDGIDEIADPALRQRVSRIIEKSALRYPICRFVITSRENGYEGATRVSGEFGLAKVRDFSPEEVRQFVRDWMRTVETTLVGSEAPEIIRLANEQAEKLIYSIETTVRVAELAVNPLLLTVIALVHRYRAQLPARRSELYEETVEVLLGHWDEAKGLQREFDSVRIELDSGDLRSLLEPVAFWLHERKLREIEKEDLISLLLPAFNTMTLSNSQAVKALDEFLRLISERSGLLVEQGIGTYSFAHLTFQEYLAARALADSEDALEFMLRHLSDPWWREVFLLQAGYLSTQGKRRVSELIQTIMNADPTMEPESHYFLLLAAECLFDVGPARVEGNLLGETRNRLQKQANKPIYKGDHTSVLQKITAMNALAHIESGRIVANYWKPPWGEPEWVAIPAGEFWMGSDTDHDNIKPLHRLFLREFQISKVPVTNAQYDLYVRDTKMNPPSYWRGGQIPKGYENHPVVNVTWFDALAYCRWLSEKINKSVTLPSEAEWEKAARGTRESNGWPWGDWIDLRANTIELGLADTTPVGLFLNGASIYGILDMSGNIWEWTRSCYGFWDNNKNDYVVFYQYPYVTEDGREEINTKKDWIRVYRGGSSNFEAVEARYSVRGRGFPDDNYVDVGFRLAVH